MSHEVGTGPRACINSVRSAPSTVSSTSRSSARPYSTIFGSMLRANSAQRRYATAFSPMHTVISASGLGLRARLGLEARVSHVVSQLRAYVQPCAGALEGLADEMLKRSEHR